MLLVVVLLVGGVVVTKFLTSAIDFYCNVDEIGRKSGCEDDRRLRIQGTVEEGSVEKVGAVTDFMISFNGVSKEVRYEGDPGGLFQECIPVVVHGIARRGRRVPRRQARGEALQRVRGREPRSTRTRRDQRHVRNHKPERAHRARGPDRRSGGQRVRRARSCRSPRSPATARRCARSPTTHGWPSAAP